MKYENSINTMKEFTLDNMPIHSYKSVHSRVIVVIILIFFFFFVCYSYLTQILKEHHDYIGQIDTIRHNQTKIYDIMCFPPFVAKPDMNFSIESIKRFVPWIRNICVFCKRDSFPEHILRDPRIIIVEKDPVEYSCVDPNLSENFLILHPYSVVTNYIFPWQFFKMVDNKMKVINTGHRYVSGMNRKMLNECIYQRQMMDTQIQLKYAYWYAQKKNTLESPFLNDGYKQHVSCPLIIPSVKLMHKFVSNVLKQTLEYPEKTELEERVTNKACYYLKLFDHYNDDVRYPTKSDFGSIPTIYIFVYHKPLNPPDILPFCRRMFARKSHYICIYTRGKTLDEIGASIMKYLKTTTGKVVNDYKVLDIYYKDTDLIKQVSTKLSSLFGTTTTLLSITDELKQSQEMELVRLRSL